MPRSLLRPYSTLAVLGPLFCAPSTALAWDPIDLNLSCLEQPIRTLGSNEIDIVLHVEECPPPNSGNDLDGDGWVDTQTCVESLDDLELGQMLWAMEDVNNMVESVHGVDLAFNLSVRWDSFTFGTAVHDPNPTIHIGFLVDNDTPTTVAAVTPLYDQPEDCHWSEAHMFINAPSVMDQLFTFWDMGTPGSDYYERAYLAQGGGSFFRAIYLHELLHALGLNHSQTEYSHTNYTRPPWRRAVADEMMQPLPDDVAALRYLYPDNTPFGQVDFFLTNSWPNFSEDATPDEPDEYITPALQTCRVNGGHEGYDRWEDADGCGPDADGVPDFDCYQQCGGRDDDPGMPVIVCPGEEVYTSVTVNNVGTLDLDLEMRALFSADDVLDFTDTLSPTIQHKQVDATESRNAKRTYEVPDVPDGEYRVIVAANAQGEIDWYPLRGSILVFRELCQTTWTPLPLPAPPPTHGGPPVLFEY